MTKYKGKYKSSSGLMQQNRKRLLHASLIWIGVGVGVGGLVFGCVRLSDTVSLSRVSTQIVEETVMEKESSQMKLPKVRLNREMVPMVNFGRCSYGRTFCDMNEEQLIAAKANGIKDVSGVEGMIERGELYEIKSNDLYVIDTLTHSRPFLVSDAALMLDYIGMRFQEVLAETGRTGHGYRPIVTSVLRCPKDVARLRRVNRNASENSCHVYGTTIDITYIRFLRDDGEEVNELWLKEALAKTMYELRYEGICYVRYEYRQGCFHITVRDTEYRGELASTTHYYDANHDIQLSLLAFINEESMGKDVMMAEQRNVAEEDDWGSKREQRRVKREQARLMKKALVQQRKVDKEQQKAMKKIEKDVDQEEVHYAKKVKYNASSSRKNYVTYEEQSNRKVIEEKQMNENREKRGSTYVSEYIVF